MAIEIGRHLAIVVGVAGGQSADDGDGRTYECAFAASEEDGDRRSDERTGGSSADDDVRHSIAIEIRQDDAAVDFLPVVGALGEAAVAVAVEDCKAAGNDVGEAIAVHIRNRQGAARADRVTGGWAKGAISR